MPRARARRICRWVAARKWRAQRRKRAVRPGPGGQQGQQQQAAAGGRQHPGGERDPGSGQEQGRDQQGGQGRQIEQKSQRETGGGRAQFHAQFGPEEIDIDQFAGAGGEQIHAQSPDQHDQEQAEKAGGLADRLQHDAVTQGTHDLHGHREDEKQSEKRKMDGQNQIGHLPPGDVREQPAEYADCQQQAGCDIQKRLQAAVIGNHGPLPIMPGGERR